MKIILTPLPVVKRPVRNDAPQDRPAKRRRGQRHKDPPKAPLRLPAPVWVTLTGGRRVNGTFVWADHPRGDCKDKVRGHRAAFLFVFPDDEGNGRVFARPTSAEQYVRGNRTGKGWSQIRCQTEGERRLSEYRGAGPGFVNPPYMTDVDADELLLQARKTRITERSYTKGDIFSALVRSDVTMADDVFERFVAELEHGI